MGRICETISREPIEIRSDWAAATLQAIGRIVNTAPPSCDKPHAPVSFTIAIIISMASRSRLSAASIASMLENSDDDERNADSDHFMLDAAAYNSFVLFTEKNPAVLERNVKIQRRLHLEQMSKNLAENAIRQRIQQWKDTNFQSITTQLRSVAKKYGYIADTTASVFDHQVTSLPSSGRCFVCPRALDRKCKTRCMECKRFVCKEHFSVTCSLCSSDVQL